MAFTLGPVPIVASGELQEFVNLLWNKLSILEAELQYLGIEELHRPPDRAVEGMLVYADGTDWNPGSGAGLYRWSGAAWVKI